MKKFKKILAVLTAIFMIATSSLAAEISFDNSVISGNSVSIDVKITSIPGDIQDISAVTIKYSYDIDKLEYVGAVSEVYTTLVATDGNIVWYDPASLTENTQKITAEKLTETNGKLCTIHFNKIDDATGKVTVEVTFLELADATLTVSMEATADSGIIDLGGDNQGGTGSEGGDNQGGTGSEGGDNQGGTGSDDGDDEGESGSGSGGSSGNKPSGGSGNKPSGGSGNKPSGGSGNKPSGSTGGGIVVTPPAPPAEPEFKGFADLNSDNWAYTYAQDLMEKGIISGDGSEQPAVRPNDNITREEAAKIALLAMGVEPEDGAELSFNDSSDVSDWAKPYIATAVKHGVISGYDDNTVRPGNYITREEMLTILARAMKWQVTESTLAFADSSHVSSWAVANIAYAVELGVMKGYEDNTIRPGATITRAETFALVSRCIQ